MKTLLLTTIMALGTAAAGAQDAGDKAGTVVAVNRPEHVLPTLRRKRRKRD